MMFVMTSLSSESYENLIAKDIGFQSSKLFVLLVESLINLWPQSSFDLLGQVE